MSRRLVMAAAIAAMFAADMSPALAEGGFDEWLKGVFDAPGLHAGKYYPDKRVPRAPKKVDPLKLIRRAMVSGDEVSDKQLIRLADSGDDLAAYNLAKRIEAAGDPARLAVAIDYYIRAIKGGRSFALRPLAALLEAGAGADDPELLARALALFEDKATKDPLARDALVRMYRSGMPFGLEPARADMLVAEAAQAGDSQAALDLAFLLLSGTPEPEKVAEAKGYLQIAALSETLSIRTVAENLLRGLDPVPLTATTEIVQ